MNKEILNSFFLEDEDWQENLPEEEGTEEDIETEEGDTEEEPEIE